MKNWHVSVFYRFFAGGAKRYDYVITADAECAAIDRAMSLAFEEAGHRDGHIEPVCVYPCN